MRIEEQSLSLPVVQKQTTLLKERIQDLERELSVKEVEKKVLQDQLTLVKEDYATLRLAQMADPRAD